MLNHFNQNTPVQIKQPIIDKNIRSYLPQDYELLANYMNDLGKFYDGHDEQNPFIDQLVGTEIEDKNGFFTKNKSMLVYDINGETGGMICLNYKRGGSTKIGPLIVNPNFRGQGIGTKLMQLADQVALVGGIRKLYATTSHLNEAVNSLFIKQGYKIEAKFPDQYKKGSIEYIWGKHIQQPNYINDNDINSVLIEQDNITNLKVKSAQEQDLDYLNNINPYFQQWHDDLGSDFVDMMFNGHKRGLDFQAKGKEILIAHNNGSNFGSLTYTPKRGGPVKIYPLFGTQQAQEQLLDKSLEIAIQLQNHKLYTFVHENDKLEYSFLFNYGFKPRGILQSPYKDGHNLIAMDKFVN